MKLVVIESPYAGEIQRNTIYARRALLDSLHKGEAPIASHLLYPQVLEEHLSTERQAGIEAGFAWAIHASLIVFYIDYGWSTSMKSAREYLVTKTGIPWEIREIGKNIEDCIPTGT